jgi:hypothetical protein
VHRVRRVPADTCVLPSLIIGRFLEVEADLTFRRELDNHHADSAEVR